MERSAAAPARATDPAVAVRSLRIAFGDTRALDDISFSIEQGELFGFIGPDGGGKTTLFRILTTLLVPDGGEARVLGLDVVEDLWALRARIGYMPGRFSLYPDLSVIENLDFFASVFGTTVDAQYDLIAPIYRQIEPFRDRRASDLSGGMKQKLALSCALVHRPDILFLDEPTTGVDAVSRREFWDLLDELSAGGLTIVVSTPYMDEADRCDRVALIQGGRILDIDAPAAIGARYPLPLLSVRAADRHRLVRALRTYPHAHSAYPFGDEAHYTDSRVDRDPAAIASEVGAFLEGEGIAGAELSAIPAGIEDSFMYLMDAPLAASPALPRHSRESGNPEWSPRAASSALPRHSREGGNPEWSPRGASLPPPRHSREGGNPESDPHPPVETPPHASDHDSGHRESHTSGEVTPAATHSDAAAPTDAPNRDPSDRPRSPDDPPLP